MNTRLILLSTDPHAPSTCLHIDAGGQLLQRMALTLDAPLSTTSVAMRTVLVVPGIEARAIWLELPARNPVQARAAAALLVEDHVATPCERLHVAVAPGAVSAQADAHETQRLVTVVDRDAMRQWLDRAATLGVLPDVVVPDHLMLPAPADAGVCVAVLAADRWLVRGQRLAFSAEPALATLALAEHTAGNHAVVRIDDPEEIERAIIASASHPAINLLQGEFAATTVQREGFAAYRRALALLSLLAFSPLLLIASQAVRYELAARQLEAQAHALVPAAVPASDSTGDPLADTHTRLLQLQSAGAFARDVGALFTAVERQPGAYLNSLDYHHARGLQANVFHANATDLQSIRASVAEAGLSIEQTGTQDTDGGIRSDIVLGAAR